jgi:hypothetical protein
MATIATFAKNGLLDAMLRATASSTYTVGQLLLANAAETVLVKFKTLGGSGTEFTTPAGGATELVSSLATTHSANDTIAKAGIRDTGGANDVVTPYTMSAGLAGGGVDIVVDDAVITAAEACNITDFEIALREFTGTVCTNTLLRNRLLAYFVRQNTAVFSAAGSITVYTGLAPATAEDAATGTSLLTFTTSTTSWSAAAAGSSALAASLSATAHASGTPGYARFTWTSGGQTYVIQGTCGGPASGKDFLLDSASVTSGVAYNMTAATMAL